MRRRSWGSTSGRRKRASAYARPKSETAEASAASHRGHAIERMRAAVLSPPRRDESLSSDGPRWTRETEKTGGDAPRFDVVGIDAECPIEEEEELVLLDQCPLRPMPLLDRHSLSLIHI